MGMPAPAMRPTPPMTMGSPAPSAPSSTMPTPSMTQSPPAPIAGPAVAPDRPPLVPEEVDRRLTQLRADLRIGNEQKANWEALAEAVRAAAIRHREFAETAPAPAAIAADATALLQLQQRRLSARMAAIRAVSTAFTRLLATLDETQRKTANEHFATVLEAL